MSADMDLIAIAMRERRERQAALLADPRTPQEIRDAVDGYGNGSIDCAGLVAALEDAGASDPHLAAALKDGLAWAWEDSEVTLLS